MSKFVRTAVNMTLQTGENFAVLTDGDRFVIGTAYPFPARPLPTLQKRLVAGDLLVTTHARAIRADAKLAAEQDNVVDRIARSNNTRLDNLASRHLAPLAYWLSAAECPFPSLSRNDLRTMRIGLGFAK